MTIFDYYFYRMYLYYQARKDPALLYGSFATAAVFLNILSAVWMEILHILLQDKVNGKIAVIILYATGFYLSYIRYKKNKNIIIEKYKDSEYNTILSQWIFPSLVPISLIIGLIVAFSIGAFFH